MLEIFQKTNTIAVIGMKKDEAEVSYRVPLYLYDCGYKIYPVNPKFAGQKALGEKFVSSVTEIENKIDLVEIFRRPEFISTHVQEILSMDPLPKYVWFQLGIVNEEATRKLKKSGIIVVQDKCMLVEHRKLKLPA
jgi:predicted CoA-binding protein